MMIDSSKNANAMEISKLNTTTILQWTELKKRTKSKNRPRHKNVNTRQEKDEDSGREQK